jgi:bacterial/archaeal transporter family-2 protein
MKSLSDGMLTVLVLAAGAMLPVQALVNGRLGVQLANPVWASALQNVIGVSLMLLVIVLIRAPPPAAAQLAGVPIWAWAGGLLGGAYVLLTLLATPRLGATRAMVAVITGQLVVSVLLDHFGVLQARRPIDLKIVGGLVLLAGGAFLILRRD